MLAAVTGGRIDDAYARELAAAHDRCLIFDSRKLVGEVTLVPGMR